MNLTQDNLTFKPQKTRSSPFRMLLWAMLIVAGLWLVLQVNTGAVKPLFAPTPTPTRTANSHAQEGQALLDAGNLEGAITAYQRALQKQESARLWAELAQIQVYSSALLTTDAERAERLSDARESIQRAEVLAPENSNVFAVKSFVMDWSANPNLVSSNEERQQLLNDAAAAAERALLLDPQNALALAYLAEVLLDQQSWTQAQQTVEEAVARDPTLMDAHRVHGLVLETLGLYRSAIEAYEKAVEIAPNMTFLYIYIGLNYRNLKVYDQALSYFDRAASINAQNGIQDPLPYIAIAKTYAQLGEFFIAARNAERALEIDPYNPNTYGQLGIIYVKARNYEGALPVLKCSAYGCDPGENEVGGVEVDGLPMTSIEVAYYYLQYGSVLAALNQCAEARPVLDDVEASYGGDPVIASIVSENRAICRSFEE